MSAIRRRVIPAVAMGLPAAAAAAMLLCPVREAAAGEAPRPGGAAAAALAVRLPSPTGRIQYRVMRPSPGSITLVWADRGDRWVERGVSQARNPWGVLLTATNWQLYDRGTLYTLSPAQGSIVYSREPDAGPGREKRIGNQVHRAMAWLGPAPKVLGKGAVLGRPCRILAAPGLRVWVWRGLPLRWEPDRASGTGVPEARAVATSVETAPVLPPDTFDILPGYRVVEFTPPLGGGTMGGAGAGAGMGAAPPAPGKPTPRSAPVRTPRKKPAGRGTR